MKGKIIEMTEEAREYFPGLMGAIADKDFDAVQTFLGHDPTMLLGREANGQTVFHFLIFGGTQEDLRIFKFIVQVANENNIELNFNIRDKDGWNAKTCLQLLAGKPISREFAALMGIDLPPLEEADVYSPRERAALEAREAAYREETKDLDNKIEKLTGKKKSSCIVSMMYEETYGDHLKELFSKKQNFYGYGNLDEEKRINQETAEISKLLEGFSFSPQSFVTASLESETSLIVIPQNFEDILGKIYEFFFGHQDHQ